MEKWLVLATILYLPACLLEWLQLQKLVARQSKG